MITKKTAKRIITLINDLGAAYEHPKMSAEWNDFLHELKVTLEDSAYRPEFNSLYNFLNGFGNGCGIVREMDSFYIF